MYLHELGDGAGSFTKDDMQAGLVLFFSFFFCSILPLNCQPFWPWYLSMLCLPSKMF